MGSTEHLSAKDDEKTFMGYYMWLTRQLDYQKHELKYEELSSSLDYHNSDMLEDCVKAVTLYNKGMAKLIKNKLPEYLASKENT